MSFFFCCGGNPQDDIATTTSSSSEQQALNNRKMNTGTDNEQNQPPSSSASNSTNKVDDQNQQQQQEQEQTAETANNTNNNNNENNNSNNSKKSLADQEASGGSAVAWSISFAPNRGAAGKGLRNKKEKAALEANKQSALQRKLAARRGTATASASNSDADQGVSASKNDDDSQQQQQESNNNKQSLDVVELEIDEAVAVPRNLTTTREDLLARNHFDQNRWLCLSRPQYKRSCGVSSLTSVWNSLYSKIGYGDLPPISQEEVMTIIGFQPPFEDIRWGPYTGNTSLMRWFHKINKAKGVKLGKAFYFWKPHGSGRTIGLDDDQAEQMTMDALKNPKMALIYHCKNHYMVPIGFRQDPRAPRMAMLPKLEKSETDTRILIGEPSRTGPSIRDIKFVDIAKDFHTEAPYTFNIRHPERGVELREKCKKTGGTLHCFIGFRSDVEAGEEDEDEEGNDEDEDEDDE